MNVRLTAGIKFLFLKDDKKLLQKIKSQLGFVPNNLQFYKIAFTHRSAPIRFEDGSVIDNERLEFLGDSVIDLVIADFLFNKFPKGDEGFLTQMRSKVVKREFLNELAQQIGLQNFLISHTGNSNGKNNVYGNAFEAFIGAMYMDKGYKYTRKYIIYHIINQYIDIEKLIHVNNNFKSQLLEWTQKEKKELEIKTDHSNQSSEKFIANIYIEEQLFGTGTGYSKKEAEQKAAHQALIKINGSKQAFHS